MLPLVRPASYQPAIDMNGAPNARFSLAVADPRKQPSDMEKKHDVGHISLDIGPGLGYNRHNWNTNFSLGNIAYQSDAEIAHGLRARGGRPHSTFTEETIAEFKRMDELKTF